VGFSGYRAAQEAARYEEGLRLDKTDCLHICILLFLDHISFAEASVQREAVIHWIPSLCDLLCKNVPITGRKGIAQKDTKIAKDTMLARGKPALEASVQHENRDTPGRGAFWSYGQISKPFSAI
jgi:hypothetical protein